MDDRWFRLGDRGRYGAQLIDTREKLVAACRDAGVLFSIDAVWEGEVPQTVRFQCEKPHHEFDMFVAHSNGFPFPDELLILWNHFKHYQTHLFVQEL